MAFCKILLSDGVTELANVKSVTFKEAVNSGVDLRPGCVSSASIEVEVFNTQANAPAVGDLLYFYEVDRNNTQTLIGEFYAEPVISTKNSYKFTAYDSAQKLSEDFSSWLMAHQSNFPMTIYSLVSAACTEAGVTLGSSSWPLSTENVQAFYADGLTCRDIVSYAAELACRFVHCHSNGQVYFDWYATVANKRIYPSSGVSGAETRYAYKQDGLSYANYTTAALDRVAVHPSGEDDVAYIYPTGINSGNTLNIQNNLLLTGADAALYNAVAQNIYTELSAIGVYRPAEASLFVKENPFRAGDIVAVTDAQGVSFTTVVMSQTAKDSGAKLISTGYETYNEADGVRKSLVQLESEVVRINKLKVNKAEIEDAVINVLKANTINAEWINSSTLNTNELSLTNNLPLKIVNVDDPSSIIDPDNYIDNGWITSNSNSITLATSGTDRSIKLIAGATLTVSWEYMGENSSGGASSDYWAKSGVVWIRQPNGAWVWSSPAGTAATYGNGEKVYKCSTHAFTVPDIANDWYGLRITVSKDASTRCVRNINITSSIPMPTATLNGYGLEIGDFNVDRTGALTLNGDPVGALSNNTPADLGTADAGTSAEASRSDHVHKMPSASDVGAFPGITNVTSGAADLDDYMAQGLYYFSTGATLSNTPNGATNGWLIVLVTDNGARTKQIWHRQGTVNVHMDFYTRYYNSANWSNWTRVDTTTWITSGTANLNDYTTPGTYYFSASVTLSNVPNGADHGWLVVFANQTGSAIRQIWHRAGSSATAYKDIYVREYSSSTWRSWTQVSGYLTPGTSPGTVSGYTFSNFECRKKNGWVYVQVDVSTTATPGNGGVTVCTLPAGYRPDFAVRGRSPGASGGHYYNYSITTAGVFQVSRNPASVAANTRINVQFPVPD